MTYFLLLQGLFHRVMLQSGSAFAQWGITKQPASRAKIMAKDLLRCELNDTFTVYECLMTADAKYMTKITQGFAVRAQQF